jgi:hypothetical protein
MATEVHFWSVARDYNRPDFRQLAAYWSKYRMKFTSARSREPLRHKALAADGYFDHTGIPSGHCRLVLLHGRFHLVTEGRASYFRPNTCFSACRLAAL